MSQPVTTIPNLGPSTAAAFARIGIHDAEALHALGADAAYRRLLADGNRPHFIAYYALVLGLQGRPWRDCTKPGKAALRRGFDALVKETGARERPDIEAILNGIGVVARKPRATEKTAQPTSSRPEKK